MFRLPAMSALACVFVLTCLAYAADSPKAAETRKKLEQPVTVDYMDTLLKDVVEDLKSQVAGLGIRIDSTGGVSMNLKITGKAQDKPLKDVFEILFAKNGLGYVVTAKPGTAYDGTLLIKQGKERGYEAGQQPTATADKAPAKDKEKSTDKTASKDKSAAKEKEKPVAKEKPPEDDAEKAEHLAATKLKFAQQLANDGITDKAKTRLEELIKTYPRTKAADEARELLKKLSK